MWKHPIANCDVHDTDKLTSFRDKAITWNDILSGDTEASISSQISDMLWQDAAWRTLNEARKWSEEDGVTGALSPMISSVLDRGYIAGQVISIGKLIEKSDAKKPKRGVASLKRLADEICGNKHLFTREIWVCHDGLPYCDRPSPGGTLSLTDVQSLHQEGPTAYYMSGVMHRQFDNMSDVDSTSRTRSDRIKDSIFDALQRSLDDPVFKDVQSLRNKTIAHAADRVSRASIGAIRAGLKLDEISRAHRLLIGVYQAISAGLLCGTWNASAVPVVQFNQFEHLTQPYVKPSRLRDLRQFWNQHCQERDEWLSSAFNDLIPRSRSDGS